MDPQLRASLAAGAVAGVAGSVFFSVVHWLFVFPTWGTLIGLPLALVAGLALGWAFHELAARSALPAGLVGGAAFAGLLMLTLVAVHLVSLLAPQPPLERLREGADVDALALAMALLAAAPAGAALGWALTRAPRSALALGAAALATSVALGHNIPFFAADVRTAKMWAVMAASALVAGVLLAAVRAETLARWSRGA